MNQYRIRTESLWAVVTEVNQYQIRSKSVPNQKQISTESEANPYRIRTESLHLWSTTSSRPQLSFLHKLVPVVCVYPEVNNGSSCWNWQRTRPRLDRWQWHNGTLTDLEETSGNSVLWATKHSRWWHQVQLPDILGRQNGPGPSGQMGDWRQIDRCEPKHHRPILRTVRRNISCQSLMPS